MKKKQQKQKSELTARERKELRRREIERVESKDGKTADERVERSSRGKIYAIAALVLAVILIAVGISVPTYMSCNYMFERNPVAVIELDAGGRSYTMKFELFFSDSPIACTNFAFLASIGYFDGSVVFDTQNDWVRFGGYTLGQDENGNTVFDHRSKNEDYTSGQTANFKKVHYTKNTGEENEETDYSEMFKYQIKSDNPSFNYWENDFTLCANVVGSDATATDFQISGLKSKMKRQDIIYNAGNTSRRTFKVVPFGRPLADDSETSEAIQYVLNLERSETYMRTYFRTPLAAPVVVKNVRVYNFEEEWKNVKYEYGFESYMTDTLKGFSSTSDTWNKNYI